MNISDFILPLLEAPLPLAFVTILLLLLFSAFLKISLVFGFLRVGLGIDSFGGTFLTAGISLALTWFVMYPTFEKAFTSLPGNCSEDRNACLEHLSDQWKTYVSGETSREDKEKFLDLINQHPDTPADDLSGDTIESWRVLAPAFVVSEIRKAFSIGIKILLPFLVIDLVVAYLFTALGVVTLSAGTLSFALKILSFTALDGWSLVVENLAGSITG